jgi:hypothetical protein
MVASRRRWTGLFIGNLVPRFTGFEQGRVRDGPSAVSLGDWLYGHVGGKKVAYAVVAAACLRLGKSVWKTALAPRVSEAIYSYSRLIGSNLAEFATGSGDLPADQDRA